MKAGFIITGSSLGHDTKPTRSEAEAAANIYTVLMTGVRAVGEGFTQPDDDWMPIWMVLDRKGGATMVSTDLDKYDAVEAIAHLTRLKGAIAVGSVHSSWTLASDCVKDPERLAEIQEQINAGSPVSSFPERREEVALAIYTASNVALHTALIMRFDDKPPKLGQFKPYFGGQIDGAMVSPIVDALKRQG